MVRFIEVSKYFWSIETITTLLPTVVIECQANLQLDFSKNNIFPIQTGVCGPQAKNGYQR